MAAAVVSQESRNEGSRRSFGGVQAPVAAIKEARPPAPYVRLIVAAAMVTMPGFGSAAVGGVEGQWRLALRASRDGAESRSSFSSSVRPSCLPACPLLAAWLSWAVVGCRELPYNQQAGCCRWEHPKLVDQWPPATSHDVGSLSALVRQRA